MNCKPGDLAVIVRAAKKHSQYLGRIVTVVSWDAIECEWDLDLTHNGLIVTAPDEYLRPIRPQPDDATDEMVLIAGLPQEVVA